MIVQISPDAEADIADLYGVYDRREAGLGDHFLSCILSDIESLAHFGGIHEKEFGLHRTKSRKFPVSIHYRKRADVVTVVAVVDARRSPDWIRNRLGRA